MLTLMVSTQCLLWFSINTSSTNPWVTHNQSVVTVNYEADTLDSQSYTFANTSIQLPAFASNASEHKGVVYTDYSLLSKRTSFVL